MNIITLETFRKTGTWQKQLDLFAATFPEGMPVTQASLVKCDEVGLYYNWLPYCFPEEVSRKFEKQKLNNFKGTSGDSFFRTVIALDDELLLKTLGELDEKDCIQHYD